MFETTTWAIVPLQTIPIAVPKYGLRRSRPTHAPSGEASEQRDRHTIAINYKLVSTAYINHSRPQTISQIHPSTPQHSLHFTCKYPQPRPAALTPNPRNSTNPNNKNASTYPPHHSPRHHRPRSPHARAPPHGRRLHHRRHELLGS